MRLVLGKKRWGQGEELERDRKKRFTKELTDAGKGFLGGNELPVTRSEQVDSVEPCGLEGVSNSLPEVESVRWGVV